jgi:hypothetical protein
MYKTDIAPGNKLYRVFLNQGRAINFIRRADGDISKWPRNGYPKKKIMPTSKIVQYL